MRVANKQPSISRARLGSLGLRKQVLDTVSYMYVSVVCIGPDNYVPRHHFEWQETYTYKVLCRVLTPICTGYYLTSTAGML